LLSSTVRDAQKFNDTEVALNVLEQNFKDEKYSEIIIDGNKAVATLS
jgi:hypothetical protein